MEHVEEEGPALLPELPVDRRMAAEDVQVVSAAGSGVGRGQERRADVLPRRRRLARMRHAHDELWGILRA